MKLLLLFAFVLVFASSIFAEESKSFALPTPDEERSYIGEGMLRRYSGYVTKWPQYRERWSKEVEKDQGAVVFLGDSITQGWRDDFKGRFEGMKLANRGIGGDTTRGMLIRLKEDVLSLNPSAVVMLMGTNDIEVDIAPKAIARNFEKIVAAIKEQSAETPIILCRTFPSSAEKNRPRETIEEVNGLFEAVVKGDPQVTVIDTWTLFADENGDADPVWFKDLLHLNEAGYRRWARALQPVFESLGLAEPEPDDFVLEEGFESLFNGNDLTGWGYRVTPPRKAPKKPRPDMPVFVEVKEDVAFDGLKESDDGRYAAMNGRLVVKTPAEGRRIQQLWTTREFSGDFVLKLEFRATPNADSGVFIRKPQLQCRDYPLAGPYFDLENYKPQDWNELVVTVEGGVARATCNGELLTDDMEVPESGPIGLEGDRGQMEYRRIRLKAL
ncbi:MAG: GDSL-type esterase/lipase family protein [Verrucomicrobiales bacterium]|nr:GDSL-type esterase/lipase family protein [Verrucomicrobiales bacterium]